MKTILYISIDPIENRRRVLNEMKTARRAGFEVEAISIATGSNRRIPFKLTHITVPFCSGPLKFIWFNFVLLLRTLFRKYEVIHLRGLWVVPAVLIRQLFNPSRLIYDAHEYFPGLGVYQKQPLKRDFWLWFERKIAPLLDLLITVSEPIAERYRARYPNLKEIAIIRNVPDFQKPQKPESPEYQLHLTPPVVLFHGYFLPQRGLENLIRAIALTDNVTLLLVGEGLLEPVLRELVQTLGLGSRIIFHPFVPNHLIVDFASQADIAATLLEPISDNHKFALPNKFFEYIMSAVPVLAGNTPTMEDYVYRFDVGITVNSEKPQEIADGISTMLSDPERLQTWKENCTKAAKELCWEKESRSLLELYKKY